MMHPFGGMRGAARSSASAKISGRLLERYGNIPSREMIIQEETVPSGIHLLWTERGL